MKKQLLAIVATAFLAFVLEGNSFAQDQTQLKTRAQKRKQDKVMLNYQNNEKFRNSLSEEQIGILQNKAMNQKQKRSAFMNSLSEQQCSMLMEKQQIRQHQNIQTGSGSGSTATQSQQGYQNHGGATQTQSRKGGR